MHAATVISLDAPKNRKRRLIGTEYDEVLSEYWTYRPDEDREEFLEATKKWSIWAFLHSSNDHGLGRNHEIRCIEGHVELSHQLIGSAEDMFGNPKSKIFMGPVCWEDVQQRHHDIARTDINRLAWDLQLPLVYDSVMQLEREHVITWHSGVWTLFSSASREYILRLKQPGKVHVAPYVEKLCFA